MNSQFIVFVQVFIIIVFVIWIASRRGNTPKPTKLKMNARSEPNPQKSSGKRFENISISDDKIIEAKVLNVIFMWNGHTWDAYEVFGLPAGSPIERVREKFNELKSSTDPGQHQFLLEALKAIESKISSN